MPSWTKKRARQHSERRLAKIRESFDAILENWSGMDPEVESSIEAAIETTNVIEEAMSRAVEAEEDEKGQG